MAELRALAALLSCAACAPPPSAEVPDAATVAVDAEIRDAEAIDALVAADGGSNDAGSSDLATDAGTSDWASAVIYFLMTDRFVDGDPGNNGGPDCYDPGSPTLFHGGDFVGLQSHLDYLESVGADAVWITPIPRQVPRRGDSCGSHGYWADLVDPDDGAIDPHLGTEAELTGLIDAMHGRGLRLIADMVVNHPGRGARIVATHPDWFHPDGSCAGLGNTEVYCPLAGLPDFAQERDDVAEYLDRTSESWLSRFAFDGVRMDTVKHVPVSYFADHWMPMAKAVRPGLYVVGEIFDEGGYDAQLRYLAAGFSGFFDFPLRRALIGTFAQGGSANGVASRVQEAVDRLGFPAALEKSNFVDNHDVPRFLSEMDDRTPADIRRDRFHLALGTIFTAPGIPQLYAGDELGAIGVYPENRRDFPAWAFDPIARHADHPGYLPDPGRTFDWVARLSAIRRQTPALTHGSYAELWRPGGGAANVFAFFRSRAESRVIVALNAGDGAVDDLQVALRRNSGIDAADQAALTDGMILVDQLGAASASARIEGGNFRISLPPRSMAIFTPP